MEYTECSETSAYKIQTPGNYPEENNIQFTTLHLYLGAWGGVVVKATSRRVPGSIPGHWGFFPGHQTVPCALGSTQPLKMSTRIFLGVKTAGA